MLFFKVLRITCDPEQTDAWAERATVCCQRAAARRYFIERSGTTAPLGIRVPVTQFGLEMKAIDKGVQALT